MKSPFSTLHSFLLNENLSPSSLPSDDNSDQWGGVNYIFNISVLGGLSCILIFLFVKLQDDHRLPEFVHLFHKLLAVWHTTDEQVTRLCGADASNYLALLRTICFIFSILSIPCLLLILPINLYAGELDVSDQLIQATVSHIRSGSPWLWMHVLTVFFSIAFIHFTLNKFERYLHSTRYREFDNHDTISAFTLMIHDIPSHLVNNKKALWDYFDHLYPGKVFRVYVPPNLVSFVTLCKHFQNLLVRFGKAKAKSSLESVHPNHSSQIKTEKIKGISLHNEERMTAVDMGRTEKELFEGEASMEGDGNNFAHFSMSSFHPRKDLHSTDESEEESLNSEGRSKKRRQTFVSDCSTCIYVTVTNIQCAFFSLTNVLSHCFKSILPSFGNFRRWFWIFGFWDWSDEVKYLTEKISQLKGKMEAYRDCHVDGADVAFVVFRDVFTATRALRDAAWITRHRVDSSLATWRWKCERAPPPGKLQWCHVGSSAWGRKARCLAVNAILSLVLVFWSSPLAILTAMNSASEKLDPEAMKHFHSWLAWAKGRSWFAATLFQFLPNLLLFLAMYCYIPMALSKLAKFELHLTLSGEQQAVLIKMVGFFLLNLFLLKALVESTLEAAIVDLGQCYSDPSHCKGRSHWMKSNFIGNSSLSAIAFFITSSLLGVSLDLLSPYSWFKRHYGGIKKNLFSFYPFMSYDDSAVNVDRKKDTVFQKNDMFSNHSMNESGQDLSRHTDAEKTFVGESILSEPVSLVRNDSAITDTEVVHSLVMSNNIQEKQSNFDQFFFMDENSSYRRNHSELSIPLLEGNDKEGYREEEDGRRRQEVMEGEEEGEEGKNGREDEKEDGEGYQSHILSRLFEQKISKGFDFPQSHSFNLTAFAISLFYSTIAPLVLPFAVFFFFYRFCVDKYNLLSMHKLTGMAVASDGKLMSTVLKTMQILLCSYAAFMIIFLWLRGDDDHVQMLFMFILFLFFFVKYGMEKVVLNGGLEVGLDGYFARGVGSVDKFVNEDKEELDYDIDVKTIANVFLNDPLLSNEDVV